MSFGQTAFLLIAGLLAGALNSVAGGGGFIAFPAMLFAGISPIEANASQTIALWPGGVASIGAYRREYVSGNRKLLLPLFLISFVGALAGALLLLHTPQALFVRLIPWLLLTATLLFSFGSRLVAMIRRRVQAAADAPHASEETTPISKLALIGGTVVQLFFAIYIGYFGAGAGILILSLSLTTFSFLPQLVRVYRRKSAADLSYEYLAVFALGISLWLVYGLLLRDVPIILANIVTLSLVISLMVMKFAYAFARR